jgi:hypothetical protein
MNAVAPTATMTAAHTIRIDRLPIRMLASIQVS